MMYVQIPKLQRAYDKANKRKPGGGRKPQDRRKVFEGILYVCGRVANGKQPPKATTGVPARPNNISWNGGRYQYPLDTFKAMVNWSLLKFNLRYICFNSID